ncbi:MAG: hypothetical protein ACXACK_19065 [Candidatus Hodarchaeales archaeon]
MNISTKIKIGIVLVVSLPSILGLGLIAANQLNLESDYQLVQPVLIDKSAFETSPRDSVEFLRVELEDDLLTIKFSYGGGQMAHDFELIGSGEYMESFPIQTTLVLSHDSHGDLAKSLITKELIFDLKPLAEDFFSIYSFFAPNITLQINLEGFGVLSYNL